MHVEIGGTKFFLSSQQQRQSNSTYEKKEVHFVIEFLNTTHTTISLSISPSNEENVDAL